MPLMPQSRQCFSVSSALPGSERKLYVMVPICTPPNTEFGLAAALIFHWASGRVAVASAILPNSRRV